MPQRCSSASVRLGRAAQLLRREAGGRDAGHAHEVAQRLLELAEAAVDRAQRGGPVGRLDRWAWWRGARDAAAARPSREATSPRSAAPARPARRPCGAAGRPGTASRPTSTGIASHGADRGHRLHLREGDLGRVAGGLVGLRDDARRRRGPSAPRRRSGRRRPARRRSRPAPSAPRCSRACRACLSTMPRIDAADEDRERGLERQVHADREQHRALDLDQDQRDAHRDADDAPAARPSRRRRCPARARPSGRPAAPGSVGPPKPPLAGCWRGRRCAAGRAGRTSRGRRPRRR